MSESISDFIKNFLASLKLSEKTLPHRNPNVAWVWVFFPAAMAYLGVLMQILNSKPILGSIEVYNAPAFEKIAQPKYPIQVLTQDNVRSDGPLWVDNDDGSPFLLYSDIQQNKIFRWEEGKGFFTVGKTLHLSESGCASVGKAGSQCETGSNLGSSGLIKVFPPSTESATDLIVCQHGQRAVMLIHENGTRTAIATHYKGRRFHTPTDMAWSQQGHLYFTDPALDLQEQNLVDVMGDTVNPESSLRDVKRLQPESSGGGLYMVHASEVAKAIQTGQPAENVFLIDNKMSKPSGLAFSPGFSKLYVSNADIKNAYWKVFEVNGKGLALKGKVFFNATDMITKNDKETYGVPEGMKVDIHGNLIAAGPGGVVILSPEAELLGRLRTEHPVTNLAIAPDGYVYMTAGNLVLRKWLSTKPSKMPELKSN